MDVIVDRQEFQGNIGQNLFWGRMIVQHKSLAEKEQEFEAEV